MVSLAAALGLALAFSSPPAVAVGAPGAGVVRVSGPSPLPPACESHGVQRSSEVEPSIAAGPGGTLVVAWQQDRYVGFAAAAIGVSVSYDGGASFGPASVPGLTGCSPGRGGASDPWVSIGPDGTAYLAALVGHRSRRGFRTRVAVSTSRDGARTWSQPRLLQAGGAGLNDKPAVTADPVRAGHAYIVWTLEARAYLAATRDGGRTWSPPRMIERPAERHGGLLSSTLSVLPDGGLLHVFIAYGPSGLRLEATRSRDSGATWSRPVVVARLMRRPLRPAVRVLPISGTGAAVGAGGSVYEALVQGGRAVQVVSSTDGGRTWSRPRTVVRRELGVFGPAIAAERDGSLAITYYAREPGGSASFWAARSPDGVAWDEHPVAGPFSLERAPTSGGAAFLGDYSGLTAGAAAFAASPPLASYGASDVFVALGGG
jgi:photosystem II stability/assembly factor-like uncharacterized protein